MKDFNWNAFKGKLLTKGLTIKQWCKDKGIDTDRYTRIRSGRTNPTEEEVKLFKSVVEGIMSYNSRYVTCDTEEAKS